MSVDFDDISLVFLYALGDGPLNLGWLKRDYFGTEYFYEFLVTESEVLRLAV